MHNFLSNFNRLRIFDSIVHNHPSGIAEPSAEDRKITVRLKEALELVDIRVLDHLVVGDGVCESFAERGLL